MTENTKEWLALLFVTVMCGVAAGLIVWTLLGMW